MLGIPLLSLVMRLFNRQSESRADERQLRRELLAHQRRQLIHQHIPDVYQARETFGARFEELLALFVAHDPAGVGATANSNAYYPELTRTVLYQLARKAPTDEQLPDLLRQELGLWFGAGTVYAEELAELTRAIGHWRLTAGL